MRTVTVSLVAVLALFFSTEMAAQTAPECDVSKCPKICQIICGSNTAVAPEAQKGEAVAKTVALKEEKAECVICPPGCCLFKAAETKKTTCAPPAKELSCKPATAREL